MPGGLYSNALHSMCGIVGIVSSPPGTVLELQAGVRAALSRMAHRGPDGALVTTARHHPSVVFGHRLLEITSRGGHGQQPIEAPDGSLLVANGEIYNHRELRQELTHRGHCFSTDSDNEVLLHGYREWGSQMESRLEGSWAAALWDANRQCLVLTRDPFGIKPLYFAQQDGALAFASEVRGLLAAPGLSTRLDPDGVSGYLAWQSLPGTRTMFRSCHMLLPGFRAIHYPGKSTVMERHTSPGDPANGAEEASIERLRERIIHAVRVRLPGNVPAGLLFSGGLDSGTVAAVAARLGYDQLHLFSVGFGRADAGWDESVHARRLADSLGLACTVFAPTDPEVADRFEAFVSQLDQPSADAFNSFLACSVARDHVRVLLSGVGADELFLGYPHHAAGPFPALPERATRWLEAAAWETLGLDPVVGSIRRRYRPLGRRRLFTDPEIRALLTLQPLAPEPAPAPGDIGAQYRQHDLERYLPDTLLRDVDFATMAHGIEARTPYLDVPLARLALQTPPSQNAGKRLLRQAAQAWLPTDYVHAPKRGFELPFARWLRGPLRRHLNQLVAEPAGIFQADRVRRLARRFEQGRWEPKKLFALVVLDGWLKRNGQAAVPGA
jgi:asparagine synthase (glutamine-hydrolysing)